VHGFALLVAKQKVVLAKSRVPQVVAIEPRLTRILVHEHIDWKNSVSEIYVAEIGTDLILSNDLVNSAK